MDAPARHHAAALARWQTGETGQIPHNKVIVVDNAVVITGSFNFTSHAENENAENLLVIRDAELAAKYAANFRAHLDHSEPYTPKGEMSEDPTAPKKAEKP